MNRPALLLLCLTGWAGVAARAEPVIAPGGGGPSSGGADAASVSFSDLLLPFRLPMAALTDTMEDMSDIFGRGYQLGLAMVASPERPGQGALALSTKPVMSFQYGRLRITSSMGGLIERGRGSSQALGFSLVLWDTSRWNTGVSLRTDRGREVDPDDPVLRHLPEVRSTLRARAMARYRITHQWSWGNSLSVDLLGHDGGTIYSTDLGFGTALAPDWRFSAGVGMGVADRTYMSSYYGVSEASAAASGGLLSPYHPKPGPQAVSASAALTWQLHPNWRLGTSVSATQLLEQAQRSPVTAAAFNYNVAVGVVFQSRRTTEDDD